MAKKNAINNNSQDLTLDPGASGDPTVQFSINGSSTMIMGVDDDDGDSFKISQGSSLGTTDRWAMTADGERTMPSQVAALAKLSATISNATGDGTSVGPIVFDDEVFDQQTNYNNSTGYFTVPVDGRYVLSTSLNTDNLDATFTRWVFQIISSNGTYYLEDINPGTGFNVFDAFAGTHSVLADMDAFDTAYSRIIVSGGTKTVGLFGENNTNRRTWISGYLAC